MGSHPEIQDKLYEEVEQFSGEIIEGGEGGACWSLYLLGSDPEIQDKLYEEVEQFCSKITEGREGGVCWALYLLGSHHEIQDKLYEELEQFCGKIIEGREGGGFVGLCICWVHILRFKTSFMKKWNSYVVRLLSEGRVG